MRKIVGRFLAALALGCIAISANAAQPVVDLSDLVDRQLIVLFSATTVGLKAKFVAGAASNAAVDGALHARLGAPSAGARLLEGIHTTHAGPARALS